MTRGAIYPLRIRLTNKHDGSPIDPTLVEDIRFTLHSSASRIGLVEYSLGNGITTDEAGYLLTITRPHSLLLPTKGRAGLDWFILPFYRSVKIDMGNITDSKANYQIPQNNE